MMHPLLELLRLLILAAVVIFCVFRVAESNWNRTYWPEIIGHALTGIGGFWQLVVYARWMTARSWDLAAQDMLADAVMYLGVALILWSATCRKLRRRLDERRPPTRAYGLQPVKIEDDRRAA